MPTKKLEDMTMDELRWHYVRQLQVFHYREERGEETAPVMEKIQELEDRIRELGGELPRPDWAY